MSDAALQVARLEFAVTASIHFLFAALTLGLLPFIAVMQTRWVSTGRAIDERMTRFWGNVYVINYAVGIITGLVMEFQFGLHWSGLTAVAGGIFGAPLAIETLVAFFLESTFLGMWIFGWGRLRRRVHLLLIWMITLTAYVSAFWVMVANGFLQHPVGYRMRGTEAVLTDFPALLANPATTLALLHIVGAALTTGGVFIAGVSAYHLLRAGGDEAGHRDLFRRSLRLALPVVAAGSVVAVGAGFAQYAYVKDVQPAKRAAMDGAGWITVPWLIMLVLGIGLVVLAAALLLFREVVERRLTLYLLVAAIPVPFVALICGWLVREVGRQPWLIYGVLRTADAVSSTSTVGVVASFAAFTAVYIGLALLDYALIIRAVRRGPHDGLFSYDAGTT